MTKPPENWQAIAIAMMEEVDSLIMELLRFRRMLREAVEDNDYVTFRLLLEYVGRQEDD